MDKKSRVEAVAEYLAGLAIAGRWEVLKAYELYVSRGYSPCEVEGMTGISRTRFRGYLNRIYEKTGSYRARVLLKLLLPIVKNIEPIVENGVCRLCGEHLGDPCTAVAHVRSRHMDVVEKTASRILHELRKKVVKQ